MEGKLGVID